MSSHFATFSMYSPSSGIGKITIYPCICSGVWDILEYAPARYTIFIMSFEERYNELNDEQKRAVDTIEGPVLVVAGPGSGKTEVLALRTANILRRTDASPGSILCLTYTDIAATNMRARLAGLIGSPAYKVRIHTFHGFCSEIMSRFPDFFHENASFRAIDEATRMEVLHEIFTALPYDNPLYSYHPKQGFTYLSSVQKSIGYLKKAAITPDDFRKILDVNEQHLRLINPLFSDIFSQRVGKGSIAVFKSVAGELRRHDAEHSGRVGVSRSLFSVLASSIELAVSRAEETGKSTPLSEWKSRYLKKDEQKRNVLKDSLYIEKLRALASVYERYGQEMFSRGYYDFDDMVIGVIQTATKNASLLHELQEQYQYILVDEFQDTNDAQMKLLRLLGSALVNEGRPNIMAVGDDDQAIYKFQGADISNILDFKDAWKDPEIIVLTKNYRSRREILDMARRMIVQGEVRLEHKVAGINKELVAVRGAGGEGAVVMRSFFTDTAESAFIAREIRRLVSGGMEPRDICVIVREHKTISGLLPYLTREGIPVHYERKRDVFAEPHIAQIVAMARFLVAVADMSIPPEDADALMPEILAFPFWGLSRDAVWRVALSASEMGDKSVRSRWLSAMCASADSKVSDIGRFFTTLAERTAYDSWEPIFGELYGAIAPSVEGEDGEVGEDELIKGADSKRKNFISPFKEYYFSDDILQNDPATYLGFLSALQVFTNALREYRAGRPLKVKDAVDFFNLYTRSNIRLNDKSPFVQSENAVTLSTVHGAKGLEFGAVFTAGCTEELWSTRGGDHSNTPFPLNLSVAPAGDGDDDRLRLFYVALTRAKDRLYITSYRTNHKGKDVSPLRFMEGENVASDESVYTGEHASPREDLESALLAPWHAFYAPRPHIDDRAFFSSLIKDYHMSVTHLNNFLDIGRGGPQYFFRTNILRFPQPKSSPSAFGTAMHKAIERWYAHLKNTGAHPPESAVEEYFLDALSGERISAIDAERLRKQGCDALRAFRSYARENFSSEHLIEQNFKHQGVVIDGAPIVGKIDRMERRAGKEMLVTDFKTGSVKTDWKGGTDHEKISLRNYGRQLVFYKLLVEGSRDFSAYRVERGEIVFLQPLRGEIVTLPFDISDADADRLRALIAVVYKKIVNLDFPDVSAYTPDIKGIIRFEEDLLNGKV